MSFNITVNVSEWVGLRKFTGCKLFRSFFFIRKVNSKLFPVGTCSLNILLVCESVYNKQTYKKQKIPNGCRRKTERGSLRVFLSKMKLYLV